MIAGLILEYLLIGIMPNLYLIGQIVGKNMTLFEIVSWFFLLIIIFVPIRKNFSLKKMKKLSFGTDLLILFLLTTATNITIFTVKIAITLLPRIHSISSSHNCSFPLLRRGGYYIFNFNHVQIPFYIYTYTF